MSKEYLVNLVKNNFIGQLAQVKLTGGNIEAKIKQLKEQANDFLSSNEIDSIIDEILHKSNEADLVIQSANKYDWTTPDSIKKNPYWKYYANSLRENLNFCEEEIEKEFYDCLEIVNQLVPPMQAESFSNVKGLVYGNVQSGKTANMAGVISLYAAAGCKIIIVFTGIHNKLWSQTNRRLRRDLGVDDNGEGSLDWYLLTDQSDHIFEDTQRIRGIISSRNETKLLIIVKKQKQVLEKLNNYLFDSISNPSDFYRYKTVLVVDDECDQASMDVSSKKINPDELFELRSTLNKEIVGLLRRFPHYSYIGYTATPYANVLNELPGDDSLFPSNFIVCLENNIKYFGPTKLFGKNQSFLEDNEYNLLSFVHDTDNEEDIKIVLRKAYIYFLIASSCKELRGICENTSMMIHESARVAIHDLRNEDMTDVKDDVDALIGSGDIEFRNEMEKIWNEELEAIDWNALKKLFSIESEYTYPPFDRLYVKAKEIADKTKIVVDNSTIAADERLAYNPDKPGYYIVIGGNTLSRGLTIEGLLVTVFYRNTSTYDNVLQMGRWYGYRRGYEDLPRLWMPSSLINYNTTVAGIDNDLRLEIMSDYAQGYSPKERPPRIRTCGLLNIVRKNAMKRAVIRSVNLFGSHYQTTIIPEYDLDAILYNIAAVNKFLGNFTISQFRKNRNNYILDDVPSIFVEDFIRTFVLFNPDKQHSQSQSFANFISSMRANGHDFRWNICVYSRTTTFVNSDSYKCKDYSFAVHMLNRSKINGPHTGEMANIKSLTSYEDLIVDCKDSTNLEDYKMSTIYRKRMENNVAKNGLLIIYLINPKSQPETAKRFPLDAPRPIPAISILFPCDNEGVNPIETVSISIED